MDREKGVGRVCVSKYFVALNLLENILDGFMSNFIVHIRNKNRLGKLKDFILFPILLVDVLPYTPIPVIILPPFHL
jgi:hypothetical protein